MGCLRRVTAALRATLPLMTLLATVGIGLPAQALDVFYAGLAFRGDDAAVKEQYPYTLELSKEKTQADAKISDLSAALLAVARSVDPPGYDLKIDEKADLKEWKGLSLALAIDRENVTVEHIKLRDHYKAVYDIGAQIVVFDYVEKQITATFPITVQLIDVTVGAAPSEERKKMRIKQLVLEPEDDNTSLVSEFQAILSQQPVRTRYKQRVGVVGVEIGEAAREFLPKGAEGGTDGFKKPFAQMFSKYLSRNQLLSVVPYSKDGAIGGTMTAQFVNGEVVDFKLDKPDYLVHLKLRGFAKVLFDEKPSGKSWIYAAYMNVRGSFKQSGKEYMNVNFKGGVTKIVPASQDITDDWAAFYESLDELVNVVTKEMKDKPDKKWVKASTKDKNARKQIQKFAEVLEKCK